MRPAVGGANEPGVAVRGSGFVAADGGGAGVVAADGGDAVFEKRYRAMKARDARFDGQFITGVHTTGIYCRPSCPARTPQPQNVSFYLTAAAAHEAGLRACKRCFPDAVPGSPEWNLRDDLSARAMRLIDDGVVDREGVDGLAARLGYTSRHLTRVISAELGAGPQALARAHRAQSARVLLQSTDLPVTQVAFASGFSSIRAFNETIAAVYETSPSALRERARRAGHLPQPSPVAAAHASAAAEAYAVGGDPGGHGDRTPPVGTTGRTPAGGHASAPGGHVTLTLPAREPFDGAGVIAFLKAHAIEGVESVVDGVYRRSMSLPQGHAVIAVSAGVRSVTCEAWLENLADLSTLASRVRRMFDLDADAVAIDEALSVVPELRPSLAAAPGLRVPGAPDAHEVLFRTLIGQQVSVKAARTVLGRLSAALGSPVALGSSASLGFPVGLGSPTAVGPAGPPGSAGPTGDAAAANPAGASGQPLYLFPTAQQFADGGGAVVRGPARRVQTIMTVAEALAGGELVIDVGLSQAELIERLTSIPGVGPWTAGYVAMRLLGAPDIFLDGDLALRAGAAAIGLPGERRELAAFAERLSPWRSYFGMHLWRDAVGALAGPA